MISSSVYIGPYIEARNYEVEIDEAFRACNEVGCSEYKREVYKNQNIYCSKCGSLIGLSIRKIKKDNISTILLREEINEDLCCMNEYVNMEKKLNKDQYDIEYKIDIWVANKNFCERKCWINNTEDLIQEINNDMILKEIELFQEYFKKTISLFHQKYGEDHLAIKWGCIQYSM